MKHLFRSLSAATGILLLMAACGNDRRGTTYYDRTIQPILLQTCAGNSAGCHVPNAGDPFKFVAGNLDVSSFESLHKRPDALKTFGPYPVPLLLIKAVGATGDLGFNYGDEFVPLEVTHAGGNLLTVSSEAYLTLLSWLENGATENGLPPPAPPREGEGPCSGFVPVDFDDTATLADENFGEFRDNVQPILDDCSSGNCHGAPQADFYVSCGGNDREIAYNFTQVHAFVDDPVDNSQVLNVPLAVNEGGLFHSGGEHFGSRGDQGYERLRDWAEKVGPVEFGVGDPGREFFAQFVQPVLIKRGCLFEGCHSPAATNDTKLRSGSQGFFSAVSLERNYKILTEDFLALEVPDARRGRAVAKTILRTFGGFGHRGGEVLETPGSGGARPENCQPFDAATASAFCIVQEWVNIERQRLIGLGQILPLATGDTVPIIYVNRNAGDMASPLEFDTFQPGADLMRADATVEADGGLSPAGAGVSLIDGCPGVGGADRSNIDVMGPDINPNGDRVAFAMRIGDTGLRLYTVGVAGNGCVQVPTPDPGGARVHFFDPAWSPDGESLAFASTWGGPGDSAPTPKLTRQLFLPQSDIFRMPIDGGTMERMTYLTNSEVSPQFMREGRVIMSTEKVSQGFYQVAGRRINWDLTDYHPLLAQRANSIFADPADATVTLPSVGYEQATEIREGFDGNFYFIFSDRGARAGAGTLAIFNRSVGPFEAGRAAEAPGFLEAVEIPDPAATGRVGSTTNGAYRSPFLSMDGRILVSYANYAGDLGAATTLDYDIVAVDRNGNRETIIGGAGQQVEAVLAIPYPEREFYFNFRQLVFGGGINTDITGSPDLAVVHFPDAPLVFTVLTANLRRGRPVELYRDARRIAAYVEEPPPDGVTTPNVGEIYESRRLVGTANLASDGSARVRMPAMTGVILELQDGDGNALITMQEEHQLGPGEVISMGVVEPLFDQACGGCHGTVSGEETDVFVTPDVLTGASKSQSQNSDPVDLN